MTGLRHGTWWDRIKDVPLDDVVEGRFTRLFQDLRPATFSQADLELLANEMTTEPEDKPTPETKDDPEENKGIPAAYTYLGQFIDHDLTLDPTSHLRKSLDREQLKALVNFRTPRFDLDNLYARGPDDQPYIYDPDGLHMLLGEPMSGNPFDPGSVQLRRGPNGRALIGDPRNDENRIVAQLRAIFLRFHNRVADHLGRDASIQDVRQQVRWHYQWMVVNDFLPPVVETATYESVFPDTFAPMTKIPKLANGLELMPVEFSVAAYRFGHSMIRPQYRLNTTVERRPIFSTDTDDAADLGGFRPILVDWAIDWQFFIDLEHGAAPAAADPLFDPIARKPQKSYKIDTSLVSPLGNLPARIASDPSILALRNLERGATFELPSGQEVAKALDVQPIPDNELVIGKATADDPKRPIADIAAGFAGNAPLWAYVLSEAQVTSWKNADPDLAEDDIPIRLGPIGDASSPRSSPPCSAATPTSYLHAEREFAPIAAFCHEGTFGLAELITPQWAAPLEGLAGGGSRRAERTSPIFGGCDGSC